MRHVILPQPSGASCLHLGNEFIALLKDSSLVSVIALEELVRKGQIIIGRTSRPFEVWLAVALIFFVMTFTVSRLVDLLEKRMVQHDSSNQLKYAICINHLDSYMFFKGVSLKVYSGEVVVIIGPSGSGKSTLLRCLNYLEQPSGGSILFENEEVDPKHNLRQVRQEMGIGLQGFNLFPHLKVVDNITLAPRKVRGN